jgi:hypothetical protein
MKRCGNCGKTKPFDDFNKCRRASDGRQRLCRQCDNAARRANAARKRAEATPCVTGCGKIAVKRWMCQGCYRRERYGDCTVDGCALPAEGPGGLCSTHNDHTTGRYRPAAEVTGGGLHPHVVARSSGGVTSAGSLYLVRLRDDDGTTFLKIGISEREILYRLNQYGDRLVDVLHVETCSLFDMSRTEAWLHTWKARRDGFHYEPAWRFAGYTECYVDRPATIRAFHHALRHTRIEDVTERHLVGAEIIALRESPEIRKQVGEGFDNWIARHQR